jgi:MFS family permease
MVTSVVFMLADSVVWLFVARGLQGLATGLALGAAAAAMLDLHPRRDPAAVGLANGVASAGGLGLGMLVSSTAVELLPAERVLPYVVLFVLFGIAFIGALAMPEPVSSRGRVRLTPQRPSVPREVRRPFLLAALAVISSWSIGGLFFSLGPQFSSSLFHSSDHLVAGVGVFVLAGSAAVAQLAFGRTAPWADAVGGSIALSVGMLMIVGSVVADSAALYLAGALVGGAGFGVAFLGALRALSAVIPPAHRSEVMSAFYVVAYGALSLPAVLAGILVTPLGLRTTFEVFGAAVAALALVVAFEAWRTRPRV